MFFRPRLHNLRLTLLLVVCTAFVIFAFSVRTYAPYTLQFHEAQFYRSQESPSNHRSTFTDGAVQTLHPSSTVYKQTGETESSTDIIDFDVLENFTTRRTHSTTKNTPDHVTRTTAISIIHKSTTLPLPSSTNSGKSSYDKKYNYAIAPKTASSVDGVIGKHEKEIPNFKVEDDSDLHINELGPGVVNPHNFSYIINEKNICSEVKPDLFMLIFIHTSPNNFKHRSAIRKTWGNTKLYPKLKTVTIFVMGKPSNANDQQAIFLESERFHDIIQEDFVDSYKNLTYKAVAGFKWVTKHCRNAKFVLKSDDDMFINVFNLVRHLKFIAKYDPHPNQIMCLVWSKMPVLRDKSSKWYVSKDEYPDDYFPQYCSGSAYVMPIVVVPQMYNASLYTKFLWVDDVYASGSLSKAANIRHKDMASLYVLKKEEFNMKLVKGDAVFAHMSGKEGIDARFKYWKKVLEKEFDAD